MARGFLLGAAVATGALVLLPGVALALGRAGRPLVRAATKTGAVAFDEFRKAGAEAFETVEDIVAEVREEMERERAAEEADATDDPVVEPDQPEDAQAAAMSDAANDD